MIGLVSFNNLWKFSSDFASLYRLLGKTCLKQKEEIQVLVYQKFTLISILSIVLTLFIT